MKKPIVIVILLILICSIFPLKIVGAENNFEVESYYVDITIKNDRSYVVTETITLYGASISKGFTRTIPLISDHEKLYIDNVNVKDENFTETLTDDKLVIKIDGNNAENLMRKKYIISYTIKQYKDLYTDEDILNLDVLESDWNTNINSAVIKIHLPGKNNLSSYSVKMGNDNVQTANVYKYMSNNVINIKTKRFIPASNKLKVFMSFKEGTFKKAVEENFDYVLQDMQTSILFNTNCIAEYMSTIQIKKNNAEAQLANIYISRQDAKNNKILIQNIAIQFADEVAVTTYNISESKDFYNIQLDIASLELNDILIIDLSYSAYLSIYDSDNFDYVYLSTPFSENIAYKSSLDITQNSPLFFIDYTPNINYYDEINSNNNLTDEIDQEFNIKIVNNNILLPSEVISVKMDYVKSKLFIQLPIDNKILFILCIFIILILILLIFIAKDKKIKINADINLHNLLDGLDPLKMKYFLNAKLNTEDIAYLILYWASKGYIKIKKENKEYVLIKINELDEETEEYQKYLYENIFSFGQNGIVNIKQLEGVFYSKAMKAIQILEKKNHKLLFDNKSQIFAKIMLFVGVLISIASLTYVLMYLNRNIMYSFIYILLFFVIPFLFNILISKKIQKKIINNYYLNYIFIFVLSIILCVYIFLYAKGQYIHYSAYILESIGVIAIMIAPFIKHRSKTNKIEKDRIISIKNYFYNINLEKQTEIYCANDECCYEIMPYIYILNISNIYNEIFFEYLRDKPDWFDMKDEFHPKELDILLNKLMYCFKEADMSNEILHTDFIKLANGYINY